MFSSFLKSFLFFAAILLVRGLDLEAALAQGKFEQIFENRNINLDPSTNPSSSMYFDNPNSEESTDIMILFHGIFKNEDYKLGLSVLILSFDTDNGTSSMEVFIESRTASKSQKFRSDVELPDSTIQEENIIRSWEIFLEDDLHSDGYMSIIMMLKNLTPRSKVGVYHPLQSPFDFCLLQIYFVATSYKVSRRGSSQNQCQSFRPLQTPDWYTNFLL